MYLLLIVLLIILLYYIQVEEPFKNCTIGMSLNDSNEPYNSPIHFMSKDELQQFFKDDPDGYAHSYNRINLHAYGYDSVEEMIDDSIQVADDFTQQEKQMLIKECNKVDQFLSTFDKIPFFPAKKVGEIPWVLAKTVNKRYEKGYPHTRMNIIFLPEEVLTLKMLPQILIHEKVHVFSRLYPQDMKQWNDQNGYISYRRLIDYPMARNNPDIDGIVYLDKYQRETLSQYKDPYPKSMEEATYPGNEFKNEHPNEALAYLVDSYLKI